ncbi:MAG: aminopeptidase P N-terminal domain-containing protein [Gemmatimonadaceae bacterium]|nr:aminopeptidase P N-terminal domain-containing protein [Gemmatimonadaceae bacterium]
MLHAHAHALRTRAATRAIAAAALVATAVAPLIAGATLGAQIPLAEYAQRRAALAGKLGDGVFVARGAVSPVQDYMSFFQSPGFLYLTGYREADATLLMTKRGGEARWTLFVQGKNPAQEVWSGRRNGTAAAAEMTQVATRLSGEFEAALDSLLQGEVKLSLLADIAESGDTLNGDDRFVDQLRRRYPKLSIAGANQQVARLRATKSEGELEILRKAIAISMDAHREAMLAIEPGMNEFEIQALVEYMFRRNGADRPAYASIVGSGENSTTLHYNRDDRFVKAGDIVVMDVAATYQGYAADLTRSFPVSGTFTPEQRAVYQVVREAQASAERNARPGTPARQMNDSARAVIANGLARLGLIESPSATYDCTDGATPRQCPQVQLYYMHGLGHGIGLEVHDPEQFYYSGVIAPGSAFTIEPGIYVRGNLLDILPRTPRNAQLAARIGATVKQYADIGVRIEDDYVVTEQGVEWVSCGLPREIDEIEALMRTPARGAPPRDATKVEWYKSDGSRPAPRYQKPTSCIKM